MGAFSAAVQYRDWHGEAKADDIDQGDIRRYLEQHKLIQPGEFLIGIRVWNGENHPGRELKPFRCHALIIPAKDYAAAEAYLTAAEPISAGREIDFELTATEFFSLFKRFSLALGWQSLNVVGRDFTAVVP